MARRKNIVAEIAAAVAKQSGGDIPSEQEIFDDKGIAHNYAKNADGTFSCSRGALLPLLKQAGFDVNFDFSQNLFQMSFESGAVFGSQTAPKGLSGEEVEEFAREAFGSKPGGNEDFRPNDEEYALISSFTNKKYSANDFKVFYSYSADDQMTTKFIHFEQSALKDMAATCFKNPTVYNHDTFDSHEVFGKVIAGKTVSYKGVTRFCEKFAIRDISRFEDVIEDFESGFNCNLSVGILIPRESFICDNCEVPMFTKNGSGPWDFKWCGHYPGMDMGEGKMATFGVKHCSKRETSRVTLGAVREAAIRSMSAESAKNFGDEELIKLEAAISEKISSNLISLVSDGDDELKKLLIAKIQKRTEQQSLGDSPMTVENKKPEDAGKDAAAGASSEVTEVTLADVVSGLSAIATALELSQKSQEALAAKVESLAASQIESAKKVEEVAAATSAETSETKKMQIDFESKMAGLTNLYEQNLSSHSEALKAILLSHNELQKQVGLRMKDSDENVARQVASSKAMEKTRSAAEASKQEGAQGFYTGFAGNVNKALQGNR